MIPRRPILALAPAAAIAAGNYLVVATLLPAGQVPRVACFAWLAAVSWEDGALGLLGVLQHEGRLLDFLEEDLAGYSDEQIGAAARGIHEGCRSALRERIGLEPVVPQGEGESIVVESGFDPAAIRLIGNVSGTPPYHGVLRHPGWRARTATFPRRPAADPRVIAPAEVEIA
ncbi:MAG: DUF2760 domain-containing protein [Deltaproteobacteria bacterium]|nr:MAG: DUF2760 domain-containing protein [Deltaproteobacteria bacterium]